MPSEKGSRIEGVQSCGGQACSLPMNAHCAPYIRDSESMGTRFRELVYAEKNPVNFGVGHVSLKQLHR